MERPTRLWIGGSSGLAETYFRANSHHHMSSSAVDWILLGKERVAPGWMERLVPTAIYIQYDLSETVSSTHLDSLISDLIEIPLELIVLTVRPALVTHRTRRRQWGHAARVLDGLTAILTKLLLTEQRPDRVVHVSSVAAAGRLEEQRSRSERDADPPPTALRHPYDRFKRECEELVQGLCRLNAIAYTSLRFGAIFSDCRRCIQCSAMALQAYVGPCLPNPIDCNSSRNAANLLRAVMENRRGSLEPVYYYTRPLSLTKPVPYGDYLTAYRKACEIRHTLWMPVWTVRVFVLCFHLTAVLLGWMIPYLHAVDYLLLVTNSEHSFDCSTVRRDFPELVATEETIEDCFRRRRRQFAQQQKVRDRVGKEKRR
jgi:nucleoside-diphosphate-sugar epimerase